MKCPFALIQKYIVVGCNATICDVKAELRRRRLISDPTNRHTHMVTTSICLHPLRDNEVLCAIGIRDLMTLHVQTKLLGGAPAPKLPCKSYVSVLNVIYALKRLSIQAFDPSSAHFTRKTGVFPSEYPESMPVDSIFSQYSFILGWEAHPTEHGKFRCIPCHFIGVDNYMLSRNIQRHEHYTRHIDAVKTWEDARETQLDTEPSSSTRVSVRKVLSSLLTPVKMQTTSSQPPDDGSTSHLVQTSDIDMDAFHAAWTEEPPAELQQLPPRFVASLEEYLNFEENLNHYSDDDEAERSDDDEPDTYLG